jgi:dTDP-4-amino-4,6-dideoxygalactose transaminase
MRQARERIAQRYSDAFSSCEELVVPTIRLDRSSSWHLYILRLRLDRLNKDRNAFIEALYRRGVACSVHFIPLHLQPYYQRVYGYQPGHFPHAEREYHTCVSLPIYPGMTEVEIHHVISAVLTTAAEFRIVRTTAAHVNPSA